MTGPRFSIARTQLPLQAGQRGVTLIELVMVMVLVGILAVFVVPRTMNGTSFRARAFHDGTLAYLRYAQKTAIAQRRTVCVNFGANSADLRIANAAGSFNCAGVNGAVLNGPDGSNALQGSAASPYTLPTPPVLNFDGLGQSVDGTGALLAAQTVTVQGSGLSITVEAGTGYVHD